MKLIDNTLMKRIEKFCPQEGEDSVILRKFFNPTGAGTWLATDLVEFQFKRADQDSFETLTLDTVPEGETLIEAMASILSEGFDLYDVIFFGYATIHEWEWGTFSVRELRDFRGQFGLGIEVDKHLGDDITISQYKSKYIRPGL